MRMRILVAEDSESFALLYKTTLEKRGHSVTIAKDGNDCIYKYTDAQQNFGNGKPPFDLVILDHKMPRMLGTDVAKEILDLNPKQRIMFVTGHVKEMMKGIKEGDTCPYCKKGKLELCKGCYNTLFGVKGADKLACSECDSTYHAEK
ncbi:hypothetical protein LCGC14_2896040 [marine sediment metagenome]|uniref:Response regulatory domain-containing protein n=1 Tax=marine sediment metagenome TaxID=412755 RepID=A0A0F8XVS7_9ZZZZ